MKLGKFIEKFSHNNMIRLVYPFKGGHETVLETWNNVEMDWSVNKKQGKFRHYVNNEVLGIASIYVSGGDKHPEAINIVIERLENQPFIEEDISDHVTCSEAVGKI
jgi:hypothetical protein